MNIPTSTYRLQINSSFKLEDVDKIANYLDKLGVSTVYAAPLFQSRSASVHGYDVTNPQVINAEIGTLEEFESLAKKLKEKKISWLQDIVPNHMAFDSSNSWLMDVFEKGKYSEYYNFFDINWDFKDYEFLLEEEKGLKGKVMAPFLGGELQELIEKGEVKIEFDKKGFFVKYYDLEYPLSMHSYSDVLSFGKKLYDVKSDEDKDLFSRYRQFLTELNAIKENFEHGFNPANVATFKELLYQLYVSEGEIKGIIDHCINTINTNPNSLESILDQQFFKLCHWKTSESKINYRRFFTINDLICLKMEDQKVFDHYHIFIKELLDKGLVQALRIDHIDGLYSPSEYLQRLRALVGEDVYIVVEKILESEEKIPDYWPIEGTSGYEFLSDVNRLFTQEKNKDRFSDIYHDFINRSFHYEDLVFEKKMLILKEKMGGELENLVRKIEEISHKSRHENLKEALAIVLSSFPIYRIYPTEFPLEKSDIEVIDFAFSMAEKRFPVYKETFDFIKRIVLLKDNPNDDALKFVMRVQQFTGPLAAKGVEDTVFYIYNRLVSHNEVGDSPQLFGTFPKEFHAQMLERLNKMPHSINATATHDTKRGEDARMRINALSEFPDEWAFAVFSWKDINKKYKKENAGEFMPDDNDEYFIYQTLIGGFPMEGRIDASFKQRLKDYLIKVVREAKVHSDWSKPNEPYENAVTDFLEYILNDEEFTNAFLPLFEKIKNYGMIYSLGQTLLKSTAPGIPDIYQGSELWDLSFVDPDNRRFVDFELREKYLEEIERGINLDSEGFFSDLLATKQCGKIKQYVLYQALNLRKKESQLFAKGEYVPLAVSGECKEQIVAFARKIENRWAITIVPKNIGHISSEEEFGVGESVWGNTAITLPENVPVHWKNIFSNKKHHVQQIERSVGIPEYASSDAFMDPFVGNATVTENQLSLAEILVNLPLALLINDDDYE